MTPKQTFALIGAGLAADRAAQTLRAEGFDGRIIIIGDEGERPYQRPPMSKEYLRDEQARELNFLHPLEFYTQQDIELRLDARVIQLNVADRNIILQGGDHLRFDKALIATGASPRTLKTAGSELEGVLTLRTMKDAERLRDALKGRPRVLVIGAGFIGCEVAASAKNFGCDVVMTDLGMPLVRVLGETLGHFYHDLHQAHGVDVRSDDLIVELVGTTQVEAARTTAGNTIPCDVVVVGVGVSPAVDFLRGQPLLLDNGVVVDEFCNAGVADIYAAGDVANWWHPILQQRMRIEHFDNAFLQGEAAAKNMLGKAEPYAPIPYFWSDQYDINLQYVGHAVRWDDIAVRGDPKTQSFSAFYLNNGRLVACAAVNRYRDLSAAKRLLATGAHVSVSDLIQTEDLKVLIGQSK